MGAAVSVRVQPHDGGVKVSVKLPRILDDQLFSLSYEPHDGGIEPRTMRAMQLRDDEMYDAAPVLSRQSSYTASLTASVAGSLSSCLSDNQQAPAPTLALLQAAPLINAGQPVDILDLKAERDSIVSALQRTGRRVKLACDFCTTKKLLSHLTDGCFMLHYSGHGLSYTDRAGHQRTVLAFEDGSGGTHTLEVNSPRLSRPARA